MPHPSFIRIGSSGALRPEIALGDLVISTGAVRLETTTSWYVHEGFPAVSNHEVVLALVEADHFWIANALFLGFFASSVLEGVTKIASYRGGVPSW